ncbi:MAG TPA: hypothetical protein VIV60_19310 [Polyangiaceae bacterium]
MRPDAVRTGGVLGSLLLGTFCSILLSAAWDNWLVATFVAVVMALLPTALSWRIGFPKQLGHASRDKAVIALPRGLAFASEQYARSVAENTDVVPAVQVVSERRWRGTSVLGPLLAVVLTPSLHRVFFPVVRVVNFTDQSIVVYVDDAVLGSVEPTSGESPAAGEVMRAPSGRHRLRAMSRSGELVADHVVEIESGFEHLYAPGSADGCFYTQRVAYGRSRYDGEARTALTSEARFWAIPAEVDFWFSPEQAMRRSPTTGGVVTLLRMGRCR